MATNDRRDLLFAGFGTTPNGVITSWNATAERLLGYRADQVIGRRVTLLLPAEDQDRLMRILARLRPGEPVQLGRITCLRKNGSRVDAIATLCANEAATGMGGAVLVFLHTDLLRARLHVRLQESRERYRRLFHGVPVGLYRSTVDGRIVDANPAFVRMLGYPDRRTLLTTSALSLYVDAGVRESWIAKLKRDGVVVDSESRLQRYDGSHIWVLATAWIARSTVGRATYFEGVIVDITERKRAQAAQTQRTAELQAFYTISRELRAAHTPQEMYPRIVEQAKALLAAGHGCLALLSPDSQTFTRAYTAGVPAERTGSTFPSAATPSERVVSAGAPFVTADFGCDAAPVWADPAAYNGLGPVMIVPVRSEEEIIGTLCVARLKGSGATAFTNGEVYLLEGVAEVAGIAIRRASLYQTLQDAYVQMVIALAQVMKTRDSYTADHSMRMVELAECVASALGCSDQQVEDIRWAARLHDIGKIGVGDAILGKPTGLSEQEWVVMRQHPALGEEILNSVERMRGVAKLVRHHQERWDGSGYPDGLRGDAIPLGARILTVVDAYGAMTETRPYRAARSHAEAVEEIRRCAGTQFDPQVVEVFATIIAGQGARESH